MRDAMEERRTDISSYVKVLVKRRRLIFWNCFLVVAVIVVISVLLPYSYTATVTLFPPRQEAGIEAMAAQLAGIGQLGQFAGTLGIPGMVTTTDLFAALLASRTVLTGVVDSLGLMQMWEKKTLDETLKELVRVTRIDATPEGLLSVSVIDRDPAFAATMAMVYVDKLDKLNREANITSAGKQRQFLEERIKETEIALAAAEESLKVFQERYGVISLEDEVMAAIEAAATLKGEIMARDVQLRVVEQYAPPQNPDVIRLRSEKQELERELALLEERRGSDRRAGTSQYAYVGSGAGFSVPFADLPQVGLELARRLREVEIQTTVFALLTQQFEAAKIAEARDTPTIQVLDKAVPPERRSFPRRKLMVVSAALLAFAFSVLLSFMLEFADNVREYPEEHAQWQWIFAQLRSDLDQILPWRRRRSHLRREQERKWR